MTQWWRDKDVFYVPIEQCGRYWRDDHDEKHADRITEYAARLQSEEAPPLIVIPSLRDGQPHYSVLDGYHRLHAAHETRLTMVRVVKAWDALHGLFETVDRLSRQSEKL